MTWSDPNELSRTGKLVIDLGLAHNPVEAQVILNRMVLQVDVGPGLENSPAGQAALLTIVNTAHRAFHGGVWVRIESNPVLTVGWGKGMPMVKAVAHFGGHVVDAHTGEHPTLVIGHPTRSTAGEVVLHAITNGWCGGVVEDAGIDTDGGAIALAGIAAGAMGVSEAFQHALGSSSMAGRRDVGVSLWRPDLPWQEANAVGPALGWLPRSLWLLGLGHLGQAHAWAMGWLPYAEPSKAVAYLMDFDTVIEGNLATGLLCRLDDVGKRKTRLVAERLERLGLGTAIIERHFDETLHPERNEPSLALAGFDDPAPRRKLGGEGFDRVVDGGLGPGPVGYLDMAIHTFPSLLLPATTAFGTGAREQANLLPAYQAEADRRIAQGENAEGARCGMLEFSGITVGAAFVGAVAGALAMADPLRALHDGEEFSVVDLDLRSPDCIQVAQNTKPSNWIPPALSVM